MALPKLAVIKTGLAFFTKKKIGDDIKSCQLDNY